MREILIVSSKRPLSTLEKLYIAEKRAQISGSDFDMCRLKKRQREEASANADAGGAADAGKAGRYCFDDGAVGDSAERVHGRENNDVASSSVSGTEPTPKFVPIAPRQPEHQVQRQSSQNHALQGQPQNKSTTRPQTWSPIQSLIQPHVHTQADSLVQRSFQELWRLQNLLVDLNGSSFSSANCSDFTGSYRSISSDYVGRISRSEGNRYDDIFCIQEPPQLKQQLLPMNRSATPAEAARMQHPATAGSILESSRGGVQLQRTSGRLQNVFPQVLSAASQFPLIPASRQPSTPTLPTKKSE